MGLSRAISRAGIALLPLYACGEPGLQPAVPSSLVPPPPPTSIAVALDEVGCDDAALELVLPFYEGIVLDGPKRALLELGLERLELVYPAPLSIPAAAWRCRGGEWSAIGTALEDVPAVLSLARVGDRTELRLSCLGSCQFRGWKTAGGVDELARSFGRAYAKTSTRPPLGASFEELRFYVQRWVSDDDPALRTDWTPEGLATELEATPKSALAMVYGWDPSSVDLGGRNFWSDGAEQNVRTLLAANPELSHLTWLNLRTFKRAIPRLGLTEELPAELEPARWQGPKGEASIRQYAFEGVEMCLASAAWQASRTAELERLAALGFRAVQLDEFPIATRWDAEACRASGHDHAPGDLVGEWRSILSFVGALSKRADELGVLLTSEEPSAVLLDLTRGYAERQANRESPIYAFFTRSPTVRPIALFSGAFSELTTAYTDADPDAVVPSGWLTMTKRSPAAATVEGER